MRSFQEKEIVKRRAVGKKSKKMNDPEIKMTGFVPKAFHSEQCAQAPSQKPYPEQHRFRNAPTTLFRLSFICTVQHKGNQAYQGIKSNCVFHRHLPILIFIYYIKSSRKNQHPDKKLREITVKKRKKHLTRATLFAIMSKLDTDH